MRIFFLLFSIFLVSSCLQNVKQIPENSPPELSWVIIQTGSNDLLTNVSNDESLVNWLLVPNLILARWTEPFWYLEFSMTWAKYMEMNPLWGPPIDIWYSTTQSVSGTIITVIWAPVSSGSAWTIVLTPNTSCSDGMSEQSYLYNATLSINSGTLIGCWQ